jgi:hypothetical protein
MTRQHADPVEVCTTATADGPVPDQFLWRGRRYLVREVLARWSASGPWWRAIQQGHLQEGGLQEGDEQRWRVLASRRSEFPQGGSDGRAEHVEAGGTYDLCFSWHTGWRLARVLD